MIPAIVYSGGMTTELLPKVGSCTPNCCLSKTFYVLDCGNYLLFMQVWRDKYEGKPDHSLFSSS